MDIIFRQTKWTVEKSAISGWWKIDQISTRIRCRIVVKNGSTDDKFSVMRIWHWFMVEISSKNFPIFYRWNFDSISMSILYCKKSSTGIRPEFDIDFESIDSWSLNTALSTSIYSENFIKQFNQIEIFFFFLNFYQRFRFSRQFSTGNNWTCIWLGFDVDFE